MKVISGVVDLGNLKLGMRENPGMWQKEMMVLEEAKVPDFRLDFPLKLKSLDKMVDDIEEDIGVTTFPKPRVGIFPRDNRHTIKASFSCRFNCDKPVREQLEGIEGARGARNFNPLPQLIWAQ